jgi:hypothetical protein
MTSNAGKRLERLHKDLAEIGGKARKFHYVVGDANESSEAKLERLRAEGVVKAGDEVQTIDVPWVINQLRGSVAIPEGGGRDPLEDPGLPPPTPIATSWTEQRDREERWKKHVEQIKRDGQLFEGDKPKDKTWR